MGRENVIMQLKEDTHCQFAWDYEHENVRKLFNFNFAGGERKLVLIPLRSNIFSLRTHLFYIAIELIQQNV